MAWSYTVKTVRAEGEHLYCVCDFKNANNVLKATEEVAIFRPATLDDVNVALRRRTKSIKSRLKATDDNVTLKPLVDALINQSQDEGADNV